MRGDDDDVVRRVRALRQETLRDVAALQRELARLHDELEACGDGDEELVRDLLHAAGVSTGIWLDDVACRFADAEHEGDELFAKAWQFLEELTLTPGGFLSREDPALFMTLRGSAAGMLARLWITGYLLGPVPEEVWPNAELAELLFAALEHHADALALADDLDWDPDADPDGAADDPGAPGAPAAERPGTEPTEPEAEPT